MRAALFALTLPYALGYLHVGWSLMLFQAPDGGQGAALFMMWEVMPAAIGLAAVAAWFAAATTASAPGARP